MSWRKGELRQISVGRTITSRKGTRNNCEEVYHPKDIPAPYDRIIAQLIAEDKHGDGDKSHDSLHRQAYARRVLDAFWYEINGYAGRPIDFRSTVLTPLLQRQLRGVEDSYGPSVQAAVGDPNTQWALENFLTRKMSGI
jgi:hypothetical protein